MTVKHEGNVVGTVMFLVFLIYPICKDAWEAIRELLSKQDEKDYVEITLVLPVSVGLLSFLIWIIFDSSWLNYDDEEKESELKTKRWIKFSVLFILPVVKLFKKSMWKPVDLQWGLEMAKQLQSFFMIFIGYLSLCSDYQSGLGRLFQPFTVPRSRVYTDKKGQKFEVNFIGSVLTILLILLPTWTGISESFGRILTILNSPSSNLTFIKDSPESRAIADTFMLILYLYVFILMLASCVKVTYFLKQSNLNYLKFVPVLLIPIAIIFTDHLCVYEVVNDHNGAFWLFMLSYFMVNLTAYVSLISPPDSLLAVIFQPHVPMINVVSDLPEIKDAGSNSKPHLTAVFQDGEN